MNLIIYTAITRGYDRLNPAPKCKGVEYRCYHDGLTLPAEGWRMIRMNTEHLPSSPQMRARWYKIHSQALEFPCPSLWVDQSLEIRSADFVKWIAKEGKVEMALFAHPLGVRNNHQEVLLCARGGRITGDHARDIIQKLSDMNYDQVTLHFASGVIYRRNSEALRVFEEDWWDWLEILWTHRDQISLPIAIDMNAGQKGRIGRPTVIPGDIWDNPLTVSRNPGQPHLTSDEAKAHRAEAREYWDKVASK